MSTFTHGTAPTTQPPGTQSPAPPQAHHGRPPSHHPEHPALQGLVNGLLIVAAGYTLPPVTWLLFAATKNHRDLFATSGFAFGDFNLLANLHHVVTFNDGIYLRWFGNSVLYSVVGSAVSAFLCVATGYAFDKYDFRGKEKLPALVNPFGVYLARVFSESYVPNEILEASRVDGAGELRILARISLPMPAPGFMTIFLFSFTASWNNFFGALVMLNDEQLYPVNLGLFMWNSVTQQQPEFYSLVIAGSLVAVVPLIVAFVCLQRFWRSGLTAGAVK